MISFLKKRLLIVSKLTLTLTLSSLLFACGGGTDNSTDTIIATPADPITPIPPIVPTNFELIVNTNIGGSIKSSLAGIDCGVDCSESYKTGTLVNLTASANPGYSFSRWAGACTGNQVCTITIDSNQTVTAYFSSGNTANLCDGLITDKLNHPMTALAKPAAGASVIDPQFGTSIRRISAASSGSVVKPMYSTIQAWNADESYLILYHTRGNTNGHHLYDGKTYKHIRKLNINPPDLEQVFWHTSDPDILMYIDNSNSPSLIAYHISTNTKVTLNTFNNCTKVSSGSDPMFTSWDSDVIGLLCQQSTGRVYLNYKISTKTEGSRVISNSSTAPQSSPSGNLFFFANSGRADILDFNGTIKRTLDLGNPSDHASLGMLSDGTDMYYGVDFGGAANCQAGALVAHNLSNGNCDVIVGQATGYPYPPSTTHVSAISHKNPGWVAVSMIGNVDGQTVLNNEIILANTNSGGSVCRVAHHRTWGKANSPQGYWLGSEGYWAEPHVVISPTATRILFGSDWGGSDTVDAYVIELPSYTP
ncbi:hypothetical protein MNBD_GAMMA22-1794 [hydrothermal vent metagenome]|uniref:Bacterial repeat domain-containing protein n=1 Tax=hydrothermal vent metagenome TaxID=652676 RepID=A0A3B0ZPN1_9ZZZZ